jgi:hypothetical protein
VELSGDQKELQAPQKNKIKTDTFIIKDLRHCMINILKFSIPGFPKFLRHNCIGVYETKFIFMYIVNYQV